MPGALRQDLSIKNDQQPGISRQGLNYPTDIAYIMRTKETTKKLRSEQYPMVDTLREGLRDNECYSLLAAQHCRQTYGLSNVTPIVLLAPPRHEELIDADKGNRGFCVWSTTVSPAILQGGWS